MGVNDANFGGPMSIDQSGVLGPPPFSRLKVKNRSKCIYIADVPYVLTQLCLEPRPARSRASGESQRAIVGRPCDFRAAELVD